MARIEVIPPPAVEGAGGGSGEPTGAAGGELQGSYPNPTVRAAHSGSAHHAQAHAIGGGDHTGAITGAQHGSIATGDLHPEYVQESLFNAAGQILYFNGSGLAVLPVGANGQVLMTDTSLGGKLKWATSSGGGGGGVTDHTELTGVTSDQHHPQAHGHDTHTGMTPNDHHDQAHALNGGDHTGPISSGQHGSLASGDLHPEYVQEVLLTAAGDLMTRNASAVARLARGTNGQVLAVNDALAAKLEWVDPITVGDGAPNTLSFVTMNNEAALTNETSIANVEIRDLKGMSGVVNVADFGAVGGNTGNQATAFNNAINALPDQGGEVVVPVEIYRFTTTIRIMGKGGVVFKGLGGRSQGSAGAVLRGATDGMDLFVSDRDGASVATHQGPEFRNVRFEDGSIDDKQTSGVDVTWAGGTATWTKSGHPFDAGEEIWTNHFLGTSAYRDKKLTILGGGNAPTSNTFKTTMPNPGVSSGTGLTITLETVPTTMTLLRVVGQTRFTLWNCAFYGGAYGFFMDAPGQDTSWGLLEKCTFDFCGVGLKVLGNGGQSVVVRDGNLLLKGGQVGFQGPNPDTNDDIAHFRASGMKFDTNQSSGDDCIGFDLGSARYLSLGPHITFEMEGDSTCMDIGSTTGASGWIGGNNFQHNRSKEGIGIWVHSAGSDVDGITLEGNQFGGAGFDDAIRIGPNAQGVKVLGGNCSSAHNGITIDNINNVTGTLIDGFSYLDSETPFNIPAGSDTVVVNCYTTSNGWIGLNAKKFGRLTSDQTYISQNTYGTIPGLSVRVGPQEIWELELVLFYRTNQVADLQVRFGAIPAGAALKAGPAPGLGTTQAAAIGSSDHSQSNGNSGHFLGGVGAGGTNGSTDLVGVIRGLYRGSGNAGTVIVQAAQNVSDTGVTRIYADSYLIARRVV